jgi:hypothetical protein
VVSMGCFSGCCGVVLADYPRGGSSRSIPLAEVNMPKAAYSETCPRINTLGAAVGSNSLLRTSLYDPKDCPREPNNY